MEVIRCHHLPELRNPVALIAFGGWNDACDVASTAADYVADAHDKADVFAELESDGFFDFQQNRPTISIESGVAKSLTWPTVQFKAFTRPDDNRDLIVVSGPEPNFHWKTVGRSIAELLARVGVEEVILAGAYVGPVTHREHVILSGVAADSIDVIRNGLHAASYEGPSGIVGVVHGACVESGIRSLSMWAPTPPYLGGNPYPRAVLAIVDRISEITNLYIDTTELIAVDNEYTDKVDAALEEAGSEVTEFIDELDSYDEPLLGTLFDALRDRNDTSAPNLDPEHTDALVDEIVEFLEGNG